MGELLDSLGNKIAGQLIRAEDWNALVAAVDAMSLQITTIESTLVTQIESTSSNLAQLRNEFDAFRSQTEPLLREYFRVTMETSKLNFAIGELATLTARVTDVLGNPLELADAASRPWIDFVAMWGQLRPVAGFFSRGGAGDRTISVQVNEQGMAQVQLRADHAEGFSQEDDNDIAGSLTAMIPERGISIGDAILSAKTPIEAKELGAFRLLSQEYNRTDTVKMRNYADAYYIKNSALVTGKVGPILGQGWRDSRATVMAFARADDNPQTPDQSRGVSSIQVIFRDWIGPWVVIDYLPERNDLLGNLRLELVNQIHGSYADATKRIREQVTDFTHDQGVLGKLRRYGAVYEAIGQLPVSNPPDYFNELVDNTKNTVSFQQAMSLAQAQTAGFAEQEVALKAFGGVTTRAEEKIGDVEGRVGNLDAVVDNKLTDAQERLAGIVSNATRDFQEQVAEAETRFTNQIDERTQGFDQRFTQFERTIQDQNQFLLENVGRFNDRSGLLENSFNSLNGRISAVLAEGGTLQAINSRVNNVEGKLGALNVLDLNADELRQGAQRANLLWSIAQGGRGIVAVERSSGDVPPGD